MHLKLGIQAGQVQYASMPHFKSDRFDLNNYFEFAADKTNKIL